MVFNSRILYIRPKLILVDDTNYRETRWFKNWEGWTTMETMTLPAEVSHIQKEALIGIAIIQTNDTLIAQEICQEVWTPENPTSYFVKQGVEVICNSSGSYHVLRKLDKRVNLMSNTTGKMGGVYVYANV